MFQCLHIPISPVGDMGGKFNPYSLSPLQRLPKILESSQSVQNVAHDILSKLRMAVARPTKSRLSRFQPEKGKIEQNR